MRVKFNYVLHSSSGLQATGNFNFSRSHLIYALCKKQLATFNALPNRYYELLKEALSPSNIGNLYFAFTVPGSSLNGVNSTSFDIAAFNLLHACGYFAFEEILNAQGGNHQTPFFVRLPRNGVRSRVYLTDSNGTKGMYFYRAQYSPAVGKQYFRKTYATTFRANHPNQSLTFNNNTYWLDIIDPDHEPLGSIEGAVLLVKENERKAFEELKSLEVQGRNSLVYRSKGYRISIAFYAGDKTAPTSSLNDAENIDVYTDGKITIVTEMKPIERK